MRGMACGMPGAPGNIPSAMVAGRLSNALGLGVCREDSGKRDKLRSGGCAVGGRNGVVILCLCSIASLSVSLMKLGVLGAAGNRLLLSRAALAASGLRYGSYAPSGSRGKAEGVSRSNVCSTCLSVAKISILRWDDVSDVPIAKSVADGDRLVMTLVGAAPTGDLVISATLRLSS